MESNKLVGTVAADFPAAAVNEVWAIAGDFIGLQKWLPLDNCSKVEGEENKPGCVRFCGTGLNWAKERLVAFDPVGHSYTYEITESNMGFGFYSGTIKVVPAGEEGCQVVWSVEMDPVEGWAEDGLASWLKTCLDRMEKVILNNRK